MHSLGEENTARHLEDFTGEQNEKAVVWEADFAVARGSGDALFLRKDVIGLF